MNTKLHFKAILKPCVLFVCGGAANTVHLCMFLLMGGVLTFLVEGLPQPGCTMFYSIAAVAELDVVFCCSLISCFYFHSLCK